MNATQYSPPYSAHMSCGEWYILNGAGGYEVHCDSKQQAEFMAEAMTRLAEAMKGE